MALRRIIILGSTGSIGRQTLGVVEHLNALHEQGEYEDRFEVVGLAAGSKGELLREQGERFGCDRLALANGDSGPARAGARAAETLVRETPCDIVVAAIVGAAGLPATLAAAELGRRIALANKEALVAAGALVTPAAKRSGAELAPIDSEHAAAWQCLQSLGAQAPPFAAPACVKRLVLTASGGPFRTWPRERAERATPEEALRHPTWSMGQKVTIDSATMMNKALELIEAHWLFGLGRSRLAALVHPRSVVHAVLELTDGSSLAQLAPADMRIPIQGALTWPRRARGMCAPLDAAAAGTLEFEAADRERFPALGLAERVLEAPDSTAGAVLNAANEEAVAAFLRGKITFGGIVELAELALDQIEAHPARDLNAVLAADAAARELVRARQGALR